MTTHLGLLQDYTMTFAGRIQQGAIGWVVLGTRPYGSLLPTFCIMFSLSMEGVLTPHILNMNYFHPQTHYQVFTSMKAVSPFNQHTWLSVVTKVVGSQVTVSIDGHTVFDQDFATPPFGEYYLSQGAQGEIGFRCHPGEQ